MMEALKNVPSIEVEYDLITSLNSRHAGEDEPFAVCTVRLPRIPCMHEEHPLSVWHCQFGYKPITMPVEKTGEATDEIYVGRFLLLPHKDVTLALRDSQGGTFSTIQLGLARTGCSRNYSEKGTSDWEVIVGWSAGSEIILHKGMHSPFVSSVRILRLTEAQCRAFVRLGGLLRGETHLHLMNLTYLDSANGKGEYILSMYATPRKGELSAKVSRYSRWRAAIELSNLDLGSCWLLLPLLCQGCQLPLDGEIVCVETLWGWMHPGCLPATHRQEEKEMPISTHPIRGEGISRDHQLRFPWAS